MALRVYAKEVRTVKRQMIHVFSYASLVIGCMLLFWAFYPIISFELYSRLFIQRDILSPIPHSQMASALQEASSVLGTSNVFSSNLKDFVQASMWFPTKVQAAAPEEKVTVKDYYLSIPKINIVNAHVVVGGEDLSKSLIHYIPTSLPGEVGNVAIFGHSTLPQLYNPKDYKTIFTYLPSLEKGDKAIIKMGDSEFEYTVYDMFVVKPDQISVLEQKYDASYLTLITCVPPGTYWNRLVIRAKLDNLPDSN
ncbi:class D sortase [Candidatus Roizmanbacteria bacterium]|nr:class D sortase [Candidatus Roizmanbacteria bacterium]